MDDAAWIRNRIRAIAEDSDRGAAQIGNDLRSRLVPWPGGAEEGAELARLIVQAKPVMAPLLHIANHLLGGDEPPSPAEGLGASGLQIVAPERGFGGKRDPVVEDGLARILDATPARPLTAMTYSASGTAEAVLDALQERGHLRRVYLSEAMPAGEGRRLAARLAAEWGPNDAEVVLTHDAALPALLPRVDVVVLGADLMLRGGIVNKVGTSVLIERAARHGVPVVVTAGLDKAPPRGVRAEHLPLPLATEAGQLHDPPTGVRTVGLAFEWVEVPRAAIPAWVEDPPVPAAQDELLALLAERRAANAGTPGAAAVQARPGGRI